MFKKVFRFVVTFIIIYLVCFGYSFFVSGVYNDEVWNYGFSYNIASGLIPYRDFNLITTPLYPLLASLFISIFGNYLFSLHLFNSIIFAGIVYIFYSKLGYKSLIIIPFVFLNCYPGYNLLSLLLILIIINCLNLNFKYYDFIIGILVGLMFLTKQTIGLCLVIPLLFYSKNRFKACIGVMIPCLLFLIYLVVNNALNDFVNYCFLGLFDFGKSNKILFYFPLELVVCLVMFYKLIKSRFKNGVIFYLLMYQIVTVPIFDDYHVMIGLIPVFYYFLFVVDIERYKIKYYFIISMCFFLCWSFKVHGFNSLNFYSDNKSYLYGRNAENIVLISDITRYIEDNANRYDHIYFFSKNAYYIKLNANYRLDKYDLILNGNMGYDGEKRYIREVNNYCLSNSCMFILYKYEFDNDIVQTNKAIVNNVITNYHKKEEFEVFDIYVNN